VTGPIPANDPVNRVTPIGLGEPADDEVLEITRDAYDDETAHDADMP